MGRRRRRKEDAWFDILPQAVGLLFLLSFISPTFREVVFGLGRLLLIVVFLLFAGLLGYVVYRRIRKPTQGEAQLNANYPSLSEVLPQSPLRAAKQLDGSTQIVEQLRVIDWFQFEKIVELVYRKLGYSVTRKGGANPDGGIDLLIQKDGVTSAIQCKQWKTWNVGIKPMREFLGALTHARIQSGIFITLNGYTGDAKQLAEKHGIQIIHETGLAALLEQANARFDPECLAILQDTRKFCPRCESEMVLRTAAKGTNAGQQFWGCSKYPKCRFILR